MIKYLVELVGTFVFLSVILAVGKPIPIVVGLLGAIYFGGHISGGHFNPAVTTMMFLKNNIEAQDAVMYIVAQLLGGAAAHKFNKMTNEQQDNYYNYETFDDHEEAHEEAHEESHEESHEEGPEESHEESHEESEYFNNY